VKAANNDPTLFHSLVTDGINRKIIPAQHFAQLDQQLGQSGCPSTLLCEITARLTRIVGR
jgi:hypothetical protein